MKRCHETRINSYKAEEEDEQGEDFEKCLEVAGFAPYYEEQVKAAKSTINERCNLVNCLHL